MGEVPASLRVRGVAVDASLRRANRERALGTVTGGSVHRAPSVIVTRFVKITLT